MKAPGLTCMLLCLFIATITTAQTVDCKHVSRLRNGDFVCSGFSGANFMLQCMDKQGNPKWMKVMGCSTISNADSIYDGEYTSPAPDEGFFFSGSSDSNTGSADGKAGSADSNIGSTDSRAGSLDSNAYAGRNAFVARFDSAGNILWKRTLGGNGTELVAGVQATADSGCLVLASTNSDSTGMVPTTHGGFDIWLIKLDAGGAVQWTKAFGGSGNDYAQSLRITSEGSLIFTAVTDSKDGDLNGDDGSGTWIVQVDGPGNILWGRRI
jgi:hypothetical protein